jgi:(hydroxyamino)benzene mutase
LINATGPSTGETSPASEVPLSQRLGRRLLRYGIVLFLLGLATGRLVQSLPLPRMGLSSHLQGVMNGTFLVVLGLVWPHLRLHALLLRAAYWLALMGTYLNWAVTLAAAAWGAGGTTMPLAAGGHRGTPDQEVTYGDPLSTWRPPRPCSKKSRVRAAHIGRPRGPTEARRCICGPSPHGRRADPRGVRLAK